MIWYGGKGSLSGAIGDDIELGCGEGRSGEGTDMENDDLEYRKIMQDLGLLQIHLTQTVECNGVDDVG